MTEKRILITGCSGFIGRHAVFYALKHGYDVVGFDHKQPRGISQGGFTFIEGDISDRSALDGAASGCDYILHLAAMTSLPNFQDDLYANYTANVVGFMNAIDAAKKNGCKKFVYASSSGVYLDGYSEDSVINIQKQRNHYSKSKLIDEMIADSYTDAYGVSCVGLRYFNLYGPDEDVKRRPSPITCMIIEIKKKKQMTIFGDGEQAKDFIYIDDAIGITFDLLESKKSNGVYNVGTGIATSFNEISKIINPPKLVYKKNPYLSSYIFYLKADTKRLFKTIGRFKFTPLKEGIARLTKSIMDA